MRVLITGIAGFIPSYLAKYIIDTTDWEVIGVDMLSYASKGWSRLKELGIYTNPRLECFTWNLEHPFSEGMIKELGEINIIIHAASSTHVDKSIANPVDTLRNNIMSTVYLLEYARTLKSLKIFQYFSTDEVYGPAPHGVNYKEWDRHNPTNPYSASKSASENICLAYQNTYKIPILITNLMNAISPLQHPEKFVPKIIKKIVNNEQITIHTESDGVTPGSRFYIDTHNIARAISFILENGKTGEKYNIRGLCEVDNLELCQKIAAIMGKELKYELVSCAKSRPGHDSRYALDGSKLSEMGFKLTSNIDDVLKSIVEWYLEHPEWLEE
jgi:dTDP-glucose 4,6-dehydratase